MSAEISVMNIVKYETIISYYDSFTVRTVCATDRKGAVTEFKMYHQDHDTFEQLPIVYNDYRKPPSKKGTFNADVEATL